MGVGDLLFDVVRNGAALFGGRDWVLFSVAVVTVGVCRFAFHFALMMMLELWSFSRTLRVALSFTMSHFIKTVLL
jgi:hypothetical protein